MNPNNRDVEVMLGFATLTPTYQLYDSLYAWELEKDGHEVKVPGQGQPAFNISAQIFKAALAGFGLAYLREDGAGASRGKGVSRGYLRIGVLPFRATTFIIQRRQSLPALALLIKALRYQGQHRAAFLVTNFNPSVPFTLNENPGQLNSPIIPSYFKP